MCSTHSKGIAIATASSLEEGMYVFMYGLSYACFILEALCGEECVTRIFLV